MRYLPILLFLSPTPKTDAKHTHKFYSRNRTQMYFVFDQLPSFRARIGFFTLGMKNWFLWGICPALLPALSSPPPPLKHRKKISSPKAQERLSNEPITAFLTFVARCRDPDRRASWILMSGAGLGAPRDAWVIDKPNNRKLSFHVYISGWANSGQTDDTQSRSKTSDTCDAFCGQLTARCGSLRPVSEKSALRQWALVCYKVGSAHSVIIPCRGFKPNCVTTGCCDGRQVTTTMPFLSRESYRFVPLFMHGLWIILQLFSSL